MRYRHTTYFERSEETQVSFLFRAILVLFFRFQTSSRYSVAACKIYNFIQKVKINGSFKYLNVSRRMKKRCIGYFNTKSTYPAFNTYYLKRAKEITTVKCLHHTTTTLSPKSTLHNTGKVLVTNESLLSKVLSNRPTPFPDIFPPT